VEGDLVPAARRRRGSVGATLAAIDRRLVVLAPLAALALGLVVLASSRDSTATVDPAVSDDPEVATDGTPVSPIGTDSAATVVADSAVTSTVATSTTTTSTTVLVTLAPDDGKTSSERLLVDAFTVRDDDLQPKSIVASGDGLFFAQNMMYRHNVAVYDRSGAKVGAIPDDVNPADFGLGDDVQLQGSPVEAAFTPDGRFVYVSNYKMFGSGYNPVADDNCDRGSWDDSFVYKIDVASHEIVAIVPTGAVPKFLQVTPDGSKLVVSNWCGFDVSIIDTATDTELGRVDVGRHPRGIAIDSDSEVAYVTVMGEARIDVIGLESRTVIRSIEDAAGTTPRHLVLSGDDRYLYVSNHRMNSVRKIDLEANSVAGTASTGSETRTMALSDDGESLYVVNYQDGTISKVRTSDMEILQTVHSGVHPVGITYDATTRQIWVANYAGSLRVFTDE
jgi:YVTN family beta-propeller protein